MEVRITKGIKRLARGLMAGGMALGVSSWAADVGTCPGEVEGSQGEVFYMMCDENPLHDNWIDNPGTLEQKLMYAGYGAALGGLVIDLARKEPSDETPAPVREQELVS